MHSKESSQHILEKKIILQQLNYWPLVVFITQKNKHLLMNFINQSKDQQFINRFIMRFRLFILETIIVYLNMDPMKTIEWQNKLKGKVQKT
jgi:hypothetical protein